MINLEREKLDNDNNNKQLDRELQIQIAQIKALGSDAMGTPTNDSASINEAAKLALEQSKLEHQKMMDNKKLDLEDKRINAENQRTEMEKRTFY